MLIDGHIASHNYYTTSVHVQYENGPMVIISDTNYLGDTINTSWVCKGDM